MQDVASAVPSEVFTDLSERGVQSFQVLAGCAASDDASAMLLDVRGLENLAGPIIPLQGRRLRESDEVQSLRRATRRAVLTADEVVNDIHRQLNSSIARHGFFFQEADAMGFAAEFLMRADRRLDERPVRRRNAPASGTALAAAAHA